MTRKQQLIPISLMTILVVLVLSFLTAVTSHAQAAATITTNQDEITVGDPILLTVSVTHAEDSVVLFPELGPNWGDFVVRDQSAAMLASNGDGTAVTTQQIDVRLFAPGDFQTQPLAITISDNQGNLSEMIAAPVPLTVQSVLIEGDTDLRDIKPQAELPGPAIWPYFLMAVLSMVAVAVFVIWKRHGGNLFVDNRPPHEKALAALSHIDKQKYVVNGRHKKLYTAVSDTLRTYFEAIGPVPMTDRTTAEIRRDLAGGPLQQDEAARLLSILEDSDLVKFAKVQPGQHEAERLTQNARQLILDTKPQPAADESKKKSGPKNRRRKGQKQMEVAA